MLKYYEMMNSTKYWAMKFYDFYNNSDHLFNIYNYLFIRIQEPHSYLYFSK